MDWLRLARVTDAAHPIVLIDEARAHLRIVDNDEDDYIGSLIAAATAFIEGPTGAGIPLRLSQWRLSLDSLPRQIDVDLCPVQSIDSITVDGVTVSPESYDVDLDSVPARIVGQWAPRAYVGLGKVKVTFTAGYDDPPADLKHAALLIIGHLYENREGTVAGGTSSEVTELPLGIQSIIGRYRAY